MTGAIATLGEDLEQLGPWLRGERAAPFLARLTARGFLPYQAAVTLALFERRTAFTSLAWLLDLAGPPFPTAQRALDLARLRNRLCPGAIESGCAQWRLTARGYAYVAAWIAAAP